MKLRWLIPHVPPPSLSLRCVVKYSAATCPRGHKLQCNSECERRAVSSVGKY